jgi:rfaE bifunctional protein nucleotidyltransferase chain/domain
MSIMPAAIVDRDELIEWVKVLRAEGMQIVLANGCFDLLHVGHVRYLRGAHAFGGSLIVGINSDRQTRLLKGEGRPFVPERERSEIIASLRYVNFVTIFDEPTVEELIRAIRPDIHAKGTDYTIETVPEREIIREVGGRVEIVGDPKDHSSTRLIDRYREMHQKEEEEQA